MSRILPFLILSVPVCLLLVSCGQPGKNDLHEACLSSQAFKATDCTCFTRQAEEKLTDNEQALVARVIMKDRDYGTEQRRSVQEELGAETASKLEVAIIASAKACSKIG